jgi:hypothetical protein
MRHSRQCRSVVATALPSGLRSSRLGVVSSQRMSLGAEVVIVRMACVCVCVSACGGSLSSTAEHAMAAHLRARRSMPVAHSPAHYFPDSPACVRARARVCVCVCVCVCKRCRREPDCTAQRRSQTVTGNIVSRVRCRHQVECTGIHRHVRPRPRQLSPPTFF